MVVEYRIVDHTADMGICFCSASLEGLFRRGGKALMQVILGEGYLVGQGLLQRKILLEGQDLADLMVRWLGELLYFLEGERLIFVDAPEISVGDSSLKAAISLSPFEEARHRVETYVKAVTYHQAKVEKKGEHWEALMILDV